MIFNVTFKCGSVYCANLVEADDIDTARVYFIEKILKGNESRFVGISPNNEGYKPGKPYHKVPALWNKR